MKVLVVCPASIVMDAGTITLGLSLARLMMVAVDWAAERDMVLEIVLPPRVLCGLVLKEEMDKEPSAGG